VYVVEGGDHLGRTFRLSGKKTAGGKKLVSPTYEGAIADVMHPATDRTLADLDLLEKSLRVGRRQILLR